MREHNALGHRAVPFYGLPGFYRSKHVRRQTPKKKKLARLDRIFRRGVSLDRVRDSQSGIGHGESGAGLGAQFYLLGQWLG